MQGHRRRRATQRSPATPTSPRVAAGRHQFLCRSSSTMHIGIVELSLRELDTVALATNATVSMKRDTRKADRAQHSQDEWFRRCSREFMHNPG